MEAAPGVTDSGVCADVNKLRSAISVTEPPCHNNGGHNKKQTIGGDEFIGYYNDNDSESESEWTGEPEENVSSCQDNAHCQCQEQVNKTLHIEDGGGKSWRLYNPFNLWREKSRNATVKTENTTDVCDCKCSSSENVLDVACSDNSNIESAFSKCSVSHANNASSLSNQDVYHSACNIDVSDGKASKDVRKTEGTKRHEDQPTPNNFRSFVLGPVTSLFQFSFRRVYPCALPVVTSNWNFENMGNLQGSESKNKGGGGTGKSPGKGKKDKSGKKSPAKELLKHKSPAPQPPSKSNSGASQVQHKVVPPQGSAPAVRSHASNNGAPWPEQSSLRSGDTTTYVVTDSWRHVKKLAIKTPATNTTLLTPPSRDSSSESVFTDPLTPQGFAEAHNNSSLTSSNYSDPCGAEQVGRLAQNSAGYFQTLSVNGTDDSVFTSLNSDAGMVGTDGVSDKDRRGGSSPLSTTDLDDVTLTLLDSTEQLTDGEDFGGTSLVTSVQKRSQSHSLDALDEEDNAEDTDKKTKSLDALEITAGNGVVRHTRTTQPPSSFTLVRHRKVELNSTLLSEHCLLPAGEHSQMFRGRTGPQVNIDATKNISMSLNLFCKKILKWGTG
jgi:hypothetical protein